MLERVAARRGRPLVVRAQDMAGGPSGLWVATCDTDYIVVERATTQSHQEHIVGHELGHILAGDEPSSVSEREWAALLMPQLPYDLVRQVLGRSTYSLRQEQEAELFAALLTKQLVSGTAELPPRPATGADTGSLDTALARLGSALQGSVTPPRQP